MIDIDLFVNAFAVMFSTILPFIELRGGIPIALALGFTPLEALILTVPVNAILFIPLYLLLDAFYDRYFSRIGLVRSLVTRARSKGERYVRKYGFLGLGILAAIPLPFFGVYSATIVSWLLKLEWKKSSLVVAIGILLEGFLVLGFSLGVIAILPSI
ncbi:MAG: COG2426 family protein [Nitrososphaerales archaeon]